MADLLALIEFVPGTKAKAQEVNANFTALKEAVAQKAMMQGDEATTFNVADATSEKHAVNKSMFDSSIAEINTKMEGLNDRFCLSSGNITAGNADLLSFSGTTLSFKIGGSFPPANWTSANGTQETIAALSNITGLSTNGTYSVIKELGVASAMATASKVTQGKVFPTSPSDGDYHCLTATGINTYKRISGAWVETQYIKLGTVTVSGNVITAAANAYFNYNGLDDKLIEHYLNGTEWYEVYLKYDSYSQSIKKWIAQGGYSAGAATRPVTFLKPFSNNNYTVSFAQISTSTGYWSASCAIQKTSATSLTVSAYDADRPVSWIACGY